MLLTYQETPNILNIIKITVPLQKSAISDFQADGSARTCQHYECIMAKDLVSMAVDQADMLLQVGQMAQESPHTDV